MSAHALGLLTLISVPPASHYLISIVGPRRFAAGSCVMQSTRERRMMSVRWGSGVTRSLHTSGV